MKLFKELESAMKKTGFGGVRKTRINFENWLLLRLVRVWISSLKNEVSSRHDHFNIRKVGSLTRGHKEVA